MKDVLVKRMHFFILYISDVTMFIFIHSLSKTEQTMSLLHDLEGNRGHYLTYCTITFWANTPLLELVFIFFPKKSLICCMGELNFATLNNTNYNNTLDFQRIIFHFPKWLILVYLHFLFSEIIGIFFIMILNYYS